PSILTILGVIMYLRFGWVVGNVGLIGTLAIVTLSTAITFLTALSISAIATDQRVRVGGAYYMISRSLGIETGGAVGIPLYFALVFSVALYVLGFAESVAGAFEGAAAYEKQIALGTTVFVAGLALFSAKIAIRSQYLIMAAIAISLISLLAGRSVEQTELELYGAAPKHSESFWVVFAVFFPAVTGIMAGVNMSGDLKDPARSIPKGTLAAVGVGYVVYMGLPILLALRADATTLIDDPLIMRKIAWWGDAILLGVWGATLSSAVGSILGGPRVLQALARDNVLPRPFRLLGKGSGEADEPRIGTVITLVIALAAVGLGNLNLVAPILTMFFLTTYTVLNIAAAVEQFLASPSYRPSFRVHWIWSLLGAVGCICVMVLINLVATIIALVVVAGIFIWLEGRGLRATWGDVRQGVWMALARTGLLRIRDDSEAKTWHPHLLVLSGAPTRRWHLIDLARSITHNRSLMTVATVVTMDMTADRERSLRATIQEHLAQRAVQALVRTIKAPDPFDGAERLVDAYGLGAVVPNTVVLGDSEKPEKSDRFARMVVQIHRAQRNVVIVRHDPEEVFGDRKRIDLWWSGLRGNGGLMMTLAYQLTTSLEWKHAEVRLKMVVDSEAAAESAKENLDELVGRFRSRITTEILVGEDASFEEILTESSQGADLVLLGMRDPDLMDDPEEYPAYYENLRRRTQGLPTTAYVLMAEDVSFDQIMT
ncbi:MAG: hypothetical protein R3336_07300, partial [Phycisphaeraceae bacterium]|nr:hypothetical protein [Phycisphaeraceae bacterium]